MQRTVVLNAAGLSRSLLGEYTPNLNALAPAAADIASLVPAVTCPVQATYLTGRLPGDHGIVANGWYDRELSEVLFWKQSNRLVQAEKIWERARKKNAEFTCANLFWWFNMVTDVDWAVTPRPVYCADGRKIPDCYSIPEDLRDEFNTRFGRFPLFQFWGPATSITSSEWIAQAAMAIEERYRPVLNLVYLPHLDYCLQRVGPHGDIEQDLRAIDGLIGQMTGFFRERKCRIVVLSEYGISRVRRAVHPNRMLRDAGFLALKRDLGREYIDFGQSRAFAVSDHQVAHVYVRHNRDRQAVKELFSGSDGVELVLDEQGKREAGLDHQRAGDLVLVSEPDSWFTYYYWTDNACAPDFARTVNIHAKPGYDPCELFIDPGIAFPKLKTGWFLLRKSLGFRCLLDVIPLDAGLVQGSHGRGADRPDLRPVFMTTEPKLVPDGTIPATTVFDLLLDHVFCD